MLLQIRSLYFTPSGRELEKMVYHLSHSVRGWCTVGPVNNKVLVSSLSLKCLGPS